MPPHLGFLEMLTTPVLTRCSFRSLRHIRSPLAAAAYFPKLAPLARLRVSVPLTVSHRWLTTTSARFSTDPKPARDHSSESSTKKLSLLKRENIYTIPNALTISRILACPVLGWSILQGDFHLATGLLVYAGLTDLADGYLARHYNMQTVLGTILDPAADKTLMTTLTVTLTMQGLLPVPLAVIILGRDVLLSLSAFWIRYTTLPEPKTFSRYWDFSLPSAEIRPTMISKVNTALQLALMGFTTIHPVLPLDLTLPLQGLQLTVATTTIWSGLSYVFSKDAVRVISQKTKPPTEP